MEAMDVTRYQLDAPPPERKNDVNAWRRALDNAHSQLEHQYNRCAVAFTSMSQSAKYAPVMTTRTDCIQRQVFHVVYGLIGSRAVHCNLAAAS